MAPKTKKIELKRNKENSFGFALKGISGNGRSLELITNVKKEAAAKGLLDNWQLISINGTSISNKLHSEVLSLVKANKKKVILKIQELSQNDSDFIEDTRASRTASKASEVVPVENATVRSTVKSEKTEVDSTAGGESQAPEPMPRSMPKTEGMDGTHRENNDISVVEPEPIDDDSLQKIIINKGSEKYGMTLVLDPHDNLFKITIVNDNSPAFKAGLQPNDELVYVNNKKVENVENFEYDDLIQTLSKAEDSIVFYVRRHAPEILVTQPTVVETEIVELKVAEEIVEETLTMVTEKAQEEIELEEISEKTVQEEEQLKNDVSEEEKEQIVVEKEEEPLQVPTITVDTASSIQTESRVETPTNDEQIQNKDPETEAPYPINKENDQIFSVSIKKISGQSCGFSALTCKEESPDGIQTIIYIDTVESESPAQHAGLIIGDQIQGFSVLQDLVTFVQKSEEFVELKVKRVDGFLAQLMLSQNLSSTRTGAAGVKWDEEKISPSEIASNMSLPMSKMPGSVINRGPAASEISLPMSKMTFTQTNKQKVAFQLGNEVANQVIQSRSYNYAPSSIEGEGQTVAQALFEKRSALRSIETKSGKLMMDKLIEEESDNIFKEEKVIVEPTYQLPAGQGKTSRIQQLLSTDDPSPEDDAVSLNVKKPFFDIEDRSVLELNLDGENVALPKLNKLLSAWKQRENDNGPVNFQISKGKTFTINPKANQ